jgi:DNA-binding transcriptional ArsR family regulator
VWPRVPRLTDGNIAATSLHAFDALGNPVRRDILTTLRTSPLAVGELAARFPVSRPAISRHLRVLEDAGLVEHRTQGARSVYAVRVHGFASVRDFLDEFWDTALSQLEELAKE